jgi:predicted NBD/HSP70 family sugar kinase
VSPSVAASEIVRSTNRIRVLTALRENRTTSRAQLARLTGLSATTVSAIIKELQHEGLVAEAAGDGDIVPRGAGRPPALLSLAPAAGMIIGIDLGDDQVRVSVADLACNVLLERRAPLEGGDADDSLDHAAQLVSDQLDSLAIDPEMVRGVVLGVPAPIHPDSPTVADNSISRLWANRRPGVELADRLGLPVTVENQANLGAFGEVTFGAARGETDLIYVDLSTRVSAGLVLGGRLYHGARGAGGEIGHVQYDRDGPVCRCGNRGCLEATAGAEAILGLLQPAYSERLTVARVVDLVETDPGTRRVVGDAGRAVGRVLADLTNALNPAAIVLGGQFAIAGEPLLAGVREVLDRHLHPLAARTVTVCVSTLGDRATILGALARAALEAPALFESTPRGLPAR